MSDKDEIQRQYITTLIKRQLQILQLNGKYNQEVTISLPKVTNVNQKLVKEILSELSDYKTEVKEFQEFKSSKFSTMLITLVLKD